jgi:hypothetical protein
MQALPSPALTLNSGVPTNAEEELGVERVTPEAADGSVVPG